MKLKYEPALDGLRAIAALVVVVSHVLPRVFPGFSMGVDVFFVLSGYLITRLLMAELESGGQIDYGAFMARRLRRLYPALAAMIGGFLIVAPFVWPGTQWEAVPAALYAMDLSRAFFHAGAVLSHTWSLGIEFQFYLLWPLVLPLVLASRRPLMVLALAHLALTAFRCGADAYVGLNLRTSGLVLGALVALLPAAPGLLAAPALLGVLGAMLLVDHGLPTELLRTVVELCSAVLVAAAPTSGRILNSRPLVFLGTISYGLYLWHAPVANALGALGFSTLAVITGTFGLGIGLAWLSWRFIETPLRTARPKMARARSPA